MSKAIGHIGVTIGIGGLYNQRIGTLADLNQIVRSPGITDVHQTDPFYRLAQHILWRDTTPVGQDDCVPLHQSFALGAPRHAELLRTLSEEWPPGWLLKDIAKTARPSVHHRKSSDLHAIA